MRTRTIIVAAIAALAILTANAGSPRAQGSLASLVAATTSMATADREVAATVPATHEDATEFIQRPVVAAPAPHVAVPAACQDAVNNLKTMHQADLAEDATERAAAQQPRSASAIAADKIEDAAERQRWRIALQAARTACLPQPGAACQAAIAALEALEANSVEDWRRMIAEHRWTELRNVNWTAQLSRLRSALAVLATACGERD